MAITAVVQTPSQIAAEVKTTGRIIPSRATISSSTLASLSDVSLVTTTATSVMMYNSGTSTFQLKEHPYLDHTPGVLTANSAVLVDANSHIDYVSTTNFRIQSSGGSTAYINEIVTTIDASANTDQLVTASAVKSYADDVDLDGGSY